METDGIWYLGAVKKHISSAKLGSILPWRTISWNLTLLRMDFRISDFEPQISHLWYLRNPQKNWRCPIGHGCYSKSSKLWDQYWMKLWIWWSHGLTWHFILPFIYCRVQCGTLARVGPATGCNCSKKVVRVGCHCIFRFAETYWNLWWLGDPNFSVATCGKIRGIPGSSGIRSGAGGWPQWIFWRMAMMWDPSVIRPPNLGMISILSHFFGDICLGS